ncbi:MAG: ABC transporter ATP-binding protein [Candidatus Bathyarchaeota archaeon]|nr:MAG: ABC transporter ATP-binding protein [Candidatus Bathyarchaeota archaeon]
MEEALLSIEGLKTYFFTEAGVVKAVDGISFSLMKGESLGLVGESGSGKTVTALSVLRIVPKPGKITGGKIEFSGKNLLKNTEKEMQQMRGSEIAIIFQDPSSSLNPVYTVETQLTDVVMAHQTVSRSEAKRKAIEILNLVGIPEAETRMREYPHQFSGGMKQRVAIARALACQPTLLFADEPTTNLDVTIQAQVLNLLNDLKKKLGMSLVMITHDMGVIAEMTSRIVVLYAGRVCEIAGTNELFERPKHPYTESLLAAVPRLDMRKTLRVIPGNIPNLITPPSGCRFHPRCSYAKPACKQRIPILEEIKPRHIIACHEWRNISLTGEKAAD